MKELIRQCFDCGKYFRKPVIDNTRELELCPYCNGDWIRQYNINMDERNFLCKDTEECADTHDIAQELEYAKE